MKTILYFATIFLGITALAENEECDFDKAIEITKANLSRPSDLIKNSEIKLGGFITRPTKYDLPKEKDGHDKYVT